MINSIISFYLWGLIIYGFVIMFDMNIAIVRKGIPLFDIPIQYIRSIVKPITINNRRVDLSFIILYFLLKVLQNILF
ncbi:MAG: hypothetical protein H8E18_10840 [FCB group bacterium]|nr:hypothetical protein [FCB group bacterium]